MKSTNDNIKEIVRVLPESPGVYQFYNKENEIIYIGKAKNLKKRVTSYFFKENITNKTSVLVNNINSIRYIVVESEEDALLLENNLIKQYQPRYNILLKDGKTYPSICISYEPFPRVFKTRNIVKNGSLYYGPYSSNYTINTLIEFIHELFPLRTCKFLLSKENIKAKKFKVCLQYHIKKCNGACENLESEEEYDLYIDAIKKILEGNANELSKLLLDQIKKLSENYEFEKAYQLKIKYDLIENYKSKSIISNTVVDETDVFGYDEDDNSCFVNILRISKGSIIQGYTLEYKKRTEETKEDLLAFGVVELRTKFNSKSKEIILPFPIEYKLKGVTITVPVKGDKKKLMDLSMNNVKQYKLDKLKYSEKLNPEQKQVSILIKIQEKLKLDKIPITIECFDNSNTSGTNPVSVCVVYKKGKPSKKEYRKYNITSENGSDDYASLHEVVKRRYTKIIDEGSPLPDLIITDGGVGHMEIVRKVLHEILKINIPIAGLAKNDKHKTNQLLFGFPANVIQLKPTDPVFKFMSNIQDEVHRFAIKFHREKRSKAQTHSELDNIKGIGEKTKKILFLQFKSLKRIQMAKFDELEKIIGTNRASIIYKHFNGI
jgi:excinuclease ABC subunit C